MERRAWQGTKIRQYMAGSRFVRAIYAKLQSRDDINQHM
ncbi:hypothetical protein YSA_10961 [Pseudomonas putida ND6]|uniref:Uncharacterized protein n=1 Tax=Pseudomonas putida ND6 TaxID=231023 RepID=I3V4P3_PSEPU|nr:hypothetical protein YSA_10961 [Pseudomonas putida ND6]